MITYIQSDDEKRGFIIYESGKEEALQKVAEIKREVEDELKSIDVEDITIHTIDSRDYLWSQDDDLFEEVKIKNEGILLSQLEYEERSRFKAFKQSLLSFLEEGERNKNFIIDIQDKLIMLIEAIIESFSSESKENTLIRDSSPINETLLLLVHASSKVCIGRIFMLKLVGNNQYKLNFA